MPTYEYRCKRCDNLFEEVHGVDDRVESCPLCGGEVRRVFHPVGIIFKGPGFYSTDSRSPSDNGGGKAAAEKEEGKTEKAGENKGEKKNRDSEDKKKESPA